MKRLLCLPLLALVVAGCTMPFSEERDAGITLQGSVDLYDADMVYGNGTPDAYSEGSFRDGCSSEYLKIGDVVYVEDFQGKDIGKGSVTTTHYWDQGERSGMVGDINDHTCLFTYRIEGVPRLDSYEISIPFIIDLKNVTQDDLDYVDSSGIYIVPIQHVEIP